MDLSEYKNAEAWEAKMINLIPDYEKVNWDFLGQTGSISSTGVGPLVNLLLIMALFLQRKSHPITTGLTRPRMTLLVTRKGTGPMRNESCIRPIVTTSEPLMEWPISVCGQYKKF